MNKQGKMHCKNGATLGTTINCADNSGAKVLKVIGVINKQGAKKRYLSAKLGDILVVSVKKGIESLRKKVARAILIRQKTPFFRKSAGSWIFFEDISAILINEDKSAKGNILKGPIPIEVLMRHPTLKFSNAKVI